ncbi:phytoene synthase [Parvibaculum indicum]|uniref:phytoene/squalene synthase family protein n=1 Tax=Parvibaculum indicum TaxID=562969 RepID=UPI00142150B3|nr:phytoene/squalene synthase family protein [Parvibaculum indicum]NIJ39824.1 phytoene synthase [Parvibaculum indicum]
MNDGVDIKASFDACLAELRAGDHDRFLSLLLAPAEKRPALLALYAFNLEIARIAETVSEPMMGMIRLQWWREVLEGLDAGETRGHHAAVALAETRKHVDLPLSDLTALVDMRERDLDEEPFEDMAALEGYAVATSGGLMSLAATVLGGEGAAAAHREAIDHAGAAFALTGLLRALPAKAAQGHVMLPVDLMRRHDLDPHGLLHGRMSEALRAAMREIGSAARAHLASARREGVPKELLPALLPASLCDRYLDIVLAEGFDPFRERSDVPAFRRQLRLLGRKWRGRI